MVRDGADGETLSEINSILGDYKLSKVTNVEKNIGLANGLFINKSREKEVFKDYINNLKKDYAAEVIFDSFNGPEVVNNWVSDKTYGMIKRTLNTLDPSYLLVLANTVAIDVEWGVKFEAESTRSEKFTLLNGTTMDSAMMHASNTVSYSKRDNA
jgi:serpin B